MRGLLAQEVIDPEDVLLVEASVDQVVELLRRCGIGAERLLHDESAALWQPGVDQRLDRVGEERRREREVHHRGAGVVEDDGERLGVGCVGSEVGHRVHQQLLRLLVGVGSAAQRVSGPVAQPLGRLGVATDTDEREVVGQFAGLRQFGEARHEVAHRDVAQADDDQPADHDSTSAWRASSTALPTTPTWLNACG